METDLVTLDNTNYDMIASMMGIEEGKATSSSSSSGLARLRIWNKPIMGAIEKNGKQRMMEVVPGGTYRIDDSNGSYKYCEQIKLRPFLQRFRYNRWLPFNTPDVGGRTGRYIKSVFTHDYKTFSSTDMVDESGGFNCGRPSGFVKDWQALPEETRKLITSVKRVRAVFGLVEMDSYLTETGEVVPVESSPIPVIWEIENNTAFKIVGDALAKYRQAGRLFPQHMLELSTTGAPMKNGNMLYQPVCKVELTKEVKLSQPEDNERLLDFQAWVNNYNKYIHSAYEENSNNHPLTTEQENVIEGFITVEDGA